MNKLIIALIILIFFLITSIGIGIYYISTKNDISEPKKEKVEEVGTLYKSSIKDLVLNILDSKGKEKLMKLSFTIKSKDALIVEKTEELRAEINDSIIDVISSISSEELMTVVGKEKLKLELIQKINKNTKKNILDENNLIESILFTEFVIK